MQAQTMATLQVSTIKHFTPLAGSHDFRAAVSRVNKSGTFGNFGCLYFRSILLMLLLEILVFTVAH